MYDEGPLKISSRSISRWKNSQSISIYAYLQIEKLELSLWILGKSLGLPKLSDFSNRLPGRKSLLAFPLDRIKFQRLNSTFFAGLLSLFLLKSLCEYFACNFHQSKRWQTSAQFPFCQNVKKFLKNLTRTKNTGHELAKWFWKKSCFLG